MENIISSPFPGFSIPKDVSLTKFLFQNFANYGDKLALVCYKTNKRLSFNQVIENAVQISRDLTSFGVKQGQVVGMCLQSSVEYLPLSLAVTELNAVCATTNPAYTVDELNYHFKLCQTSYIITDSETREKVLAVAERCPFVKQIFLATYKNEIISLVPLLKPRSNNLDSFIDQTLSPEVAFLFSSSGTTGPPKAVMLTQRNIFVFLNAVSKNSTKDNQMHMYCYSPSDVMLSVFPHFHVGGLVMGLLCTLKDGATCVILSKYQTKDYIACIGQFKPTILVAPPPVYVFLTKSPLAKDLHIPTLKYAFIAGAPVGKELVGAVCSKFSLPYLIEGYGLTEVSAISHIMPISNKSNKKHGSCGVVVPNSLSKVVDINTGLSLGPYEKGEICLKSEQVMIGYLNNPKATKETIDKENWFHSGDIGYYDEDGYFYLVDRIKELIKVKGYQVAPSELEDILLTHPGVADAAVVSVLDEYAGELPTAYVVPRADFSLTEKEIKDFISGRVVAYKRLDGGVRFINEIPKGPSGKILRRLLRDQARSEKSKL